MTTTATIQSRAIIAALNISQWTARKKDTTATEEVRNNHHATGEIGAFHKQLISKDALKEISGIVNQARAYHYEHTLPWSDNGDRILPSTLYMKYTAEMRRFKTDFEGAAGQFCYDYDTLIQDARRRLNGLFRDSDYPSPASVARMFAFDTGFSPVPDAGDFRVDIATDERQRLETELSSAIQIRTQAAMSDVWTRIAVTLRTAAAKLADTDAIFRDSLISNIRDICQTARDLNVMQSTELDSVIDEIEAKIVRLDPADLREYKSDRKAAADDIDAILRKMSGYTGTIPEPAAIEPKNSRPAPGGLFAVIS